MPRVYETPTLDAIVALLQQREEEEGAKSGAMRFHEIAEALGIHIKAVMTSVYHNRKQDLPKRRIYVARWERSVGRSCGTRGGPFLPLFLAGEGMKDAKKPRPLTSTQRKHNYLARHGALVKLREERRTNGPVSPWGAVLQTLEKTKHETARPARRGRPAR